MSKVPTQPGVYWCRWRSDEPEYNAIAVLRGTSPVFRIEAVIGVGNLEGIERYANPDMITAWGPHVPCPDFPLPPKTARKRKSHLKP